MHAPKDRNHYLATAVTSMSAAIVAIESARNFLNAATGEDENAKRLAIHAEGIKRVAEDLEGKEPTTAEADAEEPPPPRHEATLPNKKNRKKNSGTN